MKGFCAKALAALIAVLFSSSAASATTIEIGLLSFDENTLTGNSFNIVNLTGVGFPVETVLNFDVTSLVADVAGGGTLTIGNSSFTDDPGSGNLDCTVSGLPTSGGCNFAAYDLTGVTLTGTLSPTSSLIGLPTGFDGIESAFSVFLAPSAGQYLTAGLDAVIIEATLVPSTPPTSVPEPSTAMLLQLGMGALCGYRLRRQIPFLRRTQASRE